MTEPTIHFGVSGVALLRAADAMLRSLGGSEISILLPSVNLADDTSAQLGITDPGTDEVPLSPVVSRNLPTENNGPRRRLEFLLPAAVVALEATARSVVSGEDLLNGCLGLMYQGDLFHIEGITTEYFAGTVYLYRVVAVE
jgi:hypothetical protein